MKALHERHQSETSHQRKASEGASAKKSGFSLNPKDLFTKTRDITRKSVEAITSYLPIAVNSPPDTARDLMTDRTDSSEIPGNSIDYSQKKANQRRGKSDINFESPRPYRADNSSKDQEDTFNFTEDDELASGRVQGANGNYGMRGGEHILSMESLNVMTEEMIIDDDDSVEESKRKEEPKPVVRGGEKNYGYNGQTNYNNKENSAVKGSILKTSNRGNQGDHQVQKKKEVVIKVTKVSKKAKIDDLEINDGSHDSAGTLEDLMPQSSRSTTGLIRIDDQGYDDEEDVRPEKPRKKKKSQKHKKKRYEQVDSVNPDERRKVKSKKRKAQKFEPEAEEEANVTTEKKQVLLTDGLNLIKILVNNQNRKKTKLISLLFTITVVMTVLLNGWELSNLADTSCAIKTQKPITYACFAFMIALKITSISLFNLEMTFIEPYKTSTKLLAPFLAFFLCPLLQLPQNIYDFGSCRHASRLIHLHNAWKFLEAIIYSLSIILCYYLAKASVKRTVGYSGAVGSRFWRYTNALIKAAIVLWILAWNVLLILLFVSQKNVFRVSLFFDFYVYASLATGLIFFWVLGKKKDEQTFANIFVKVNKGDATPLNVIRINEGEEAHVEVEVRVQDTETMENIEVNLTTEAIEE